MRSTEQAITDAELHAWVDGQLEPGHRARVEAALAAEPALQARALHYRMQNEALRALAGRDDGAAPPRLLRAATTPPRSPRLPARLAGLAAALVVGIATGWAARGPLPEPAPGPAELPAHGGTAVLPLATAAAVAHAAFAPEVRHPVEVAASDEAHLVAWLSKRLGTPLRVPDLRSHGLSLVGGRLLPDPDGGVAAQFMYESDDGQRLTLFVRRDAQGTDTAFRFAEAAPIASFYWVDRGFGYALSGELPRERLMALAASVHAQASP